MACDLITGKRGTGKSKLAVVLMLEHMNLGRLVATNLDLKLEALLPSTSRATAIRLPDKPTAFDLCALGDGNNGDAYEEDHNGLLVLDELATWLNARTFQDKDRGPVIDWLVHSRKHGWECAFICQDMVQIDKQVRESLVEYVIRCVRGDKIRVPLVGGVLAALLGDKWSYLPKVHRAQRRLGCDAKGLLARTYWYRTGGVQAGYDTRQIFRSDYPHGAHSLLSPWHTKGRHEPPQLTGWRKLAARFNAPPPPRVRLPSKPKHRLVEAIVRCLPPDERLRHVQRLVRTGRLA